MHHPAIAPLHTAVITGGASGIGLAAAKRFLRAGLKVAIVDRRMEELERAQEELLAIADEPGQVLAAACDVSDRQGLERTAAHVERTLGKVHVLMNNAAIQSGSSIFGEQAVWDAVLSINLGGVINGTRAFVPAMRAHGEPALVINTGSKQGITTPPGDPAYNVAKAGVKVFTEALQHELRQTDGGQVEAALLIPGFVWTDLTRGERTEKPAAAWTAEQTVDFMMERLEAGDFYILCPDNDVSRELDERRILWAAGDIVENRPPLSRWHKDWAERFKAFAEDR
ncbi:SDR family oxidoreductase [Aureimonas jatrophae]|uniref:NAD(P)-dependent dehydrogenase, short-chain alcohol dehydrogenase family n=1 Tax=Aureimonas jatrophae TaxID=1166073 RepID=A0A1H0D7L7_9HYPH|nr:SDR family oxidoreductase [Aureimonas jatrophae]MBB3951743.1 NAD(P)-dependent dehydrogenase (short-subunit alcohol dehydrogenase family) [Aureimonas jatrophae]SDN66079.1 NAD(P)-dependent dehydrogenase, short-chain alcohol dehydrogenase family [Aureimonas jatrophae]